MSTAILLATNAARRAFTARYLHHGDDPNTLIPLLRRLWVGAFDRDGAAMAAGLLACDRSHLSTDPRPQPRSGPSPVTGIDTPAPVSTAAPRRATLHARIDGPLEWLYLLHPQENVVVAYEATCHHRWLRHSLHHLDPVDELFVTDTDTDTDPDAVLAPPITVCTVCGAVDEIEHHELPSMVGYGHDTCTACLRCGSSVATDPMFGAHVTRKPWPPNPAP